MTWKTHLIGGSIAGVVVSAAAGTDYMESALIMSASMLGSVLPDIDQPNSRLSRSDSLIGLIAFVTSRFARHRGFTHTLIGAAVFGAIFYALSMLQGGTVESLVSFLTAYAVFIVLHATGSPLRPLAGWLALAAYAAGPAISDFLIERNLTLAIDIKTAVLVSCSIFAGALSHILYDCFNKGGVRFLYPFSRRNFRLMEIKTNTSGEFWFVASQIVILGIILAWWGLIKIERSI